MSQVRSRHPAMWVALHRWKTIMQPHALTRTNESRYLVHTTYAVIASYKPHTNIPYDFCSPRLILFRCPILLHFTISCLNWENIWIQLIRSTPTILLPHSSSLTLVMLTFVDSSSSSSSSPTLERIMERSLLQREAPPSKWRALKYSKSICRWSIDYSNDNWIKVDSQIGY